MEELEKNIETLSQQLWEAGVDVTVGSTVPRNTAVLHMQANPAAEHFELRRQELDRLKTENVALVRRLRELEEGRGVTDAEGVVPRESWENLNTEKDELLKTVAQKELRLLRLKQVGVKFYALLRFSGY